jgi:hypothetical protein
VLALFVLSAAGAAIWLTLATAPAQQADIGDPLSAERPTVVLKEAQPVEAPVPEAAQPVDPVPLPVASPSVIASPSTATSGTGTRNRAATLDVIRAQSGPIRKCYEAGLARNPELQGTVKVTFTIAAEGRVTLAAGEESGFADSAVTQCIVRHFRSLKFPPSDAGEVIISYPIKLNAK